MKESEKEHLLRREQADSGRVVYSRADAGGTGDPLERGRRESFAPALVPLIVGFLLLVGLVTWLGWSSVRKLEDVSGKVLDLQRRQGNQAKLLVDLQLTLGSLNKDASAQATADVRGEVTFPYTTRINTAREEVARILSLINRLPLASTERWQTLRAEIEAFGEITRDPRRYSLEGFAKYRDIENETNRLLDETARAQADIVSQSEALQQQAGREINRLTIIAALAGLLIAAGTIWETQRRFRQLRRTLRDVQRERQFNAQVLEGMVSAVAAIDNRSHLRSANREFLQLFPRASVGADLQSVAAPGVRMNFLASVTAQAVERATYKGRWRLPFDGASNANNESNERSYDAYVAPLEIDAARGMILTLVDVSEAVAAESELRRKESLVLVGQATAQVAHEIKNPLGSIRLGVSMLKDAVRGDDEASRIVLLIERGIEHLNKLTVDVTVYSRQMPLALAVANLNETLDESIELVRDRTTAKRVTIEKHFSEGDLRGRFDADQLRQVFVNLLANAVDASDEDRTVKVFAERATVKTDANAERNTTVARIRIEDEGGGIDAETLAHIFEPFYTTKKRGTGLGLPIVKKIVEQHNGTITVGSEVGKGTGFTIELPLE